MSVLGHGGRRQGDLEAVVAGDGHDRAHLRRRRRSATGAASSPPVMSISGGRSGRSRCRRRPGRRSRAAPRGAPRRAAPPAPPMRASSTLRGTLPGPEARDARLAAERPDDVAEGSIELGLVDLDAQLDSVVLDDFRGGTHKESSLYRWRSSPPDRLRSSRRARPASLAEGEHPRRSSSSARRALRWRDPPAEAREVGQAVQADGRGRRGPSIGDGPPLDGSRACDDRPGSGPVISIATERALRRPHGLADGEPSAWSARWSEIRSPPPPSPPGDPERSRRSCSCIQQSMARTSRKTRRGPGRWGSSRPPRSARRGIARSGRGDRVVTSMNSARTSAPEHARRDSTQRSFVSPMAFLRCSRLGPGSTSGAGSPSSERSVPIMWLRWSLTSQPGQLFDRPLRGGS